MSLRVSVWRASCGRCARLTALAVVVWLSAHGGGPPARGQNLIVNGDFNQNAGDPAGWTVHNAEWAIMDQNGAAAGDWIFNPEPRQFGAFSYRCGEMERYGEGGLSQRIEGLTVGEHYVLTYRQSITDVGWAEVAIEPGIDYWNWSNRWIGTRAVGGHGQWWRDTALYFTPDSATGTVWVKTGSLASDWAYMAHWLDGLCLTPVGEARNLDWEDECPFWNFYIAVDVCSQNVAQDYRRGGNYALKIEGASSWTAGAVQRVRYASHNAQPGDTLIFSVYCMNRSAAGGWGDDDPHPHGQIRIGCNPYGHTLRSSAMWGPWANRSWTGGVWHRVEVSFVVPVGPLFFTLFLEARQTGTEHCVAYFDDAEVAVFTPTETPTATPTATPTNTPTATPVLVGKDSQEFDGNGVQCVGSMLGVYHPVLCATGPLAPPGVITLEQAPEIHVAGFRVGGAVRITPSVTFDNASLTLEFSSEDLANFGGALNQWRAVRLLEPIVGLQPAGVVVLSTVEANPVPVRSAGGVDMYELVVSPFAEVEGDAIFAVLPLFLDTREWARY